MSELKTNKIQTNDTNNVAIDNALGLKSYTTAQRDALTSVAGDMIYNTTTSKAEYYTGSAWVETGGADVIQMEYLLVGGGGGGGSGRNNANNGNGGGGGGAGGLITNVSGSNSGGGNAANPLMYVVPSTNYKVTVGAGGAQGQGAYTTQPSAERGGTGGSRSQFGTLRVRGGGGGGGRNSPPTTFEGMTNGSKGGSSGSGSTTADDEQGYGGGSSYSNYKFGGGGGAGAAGVNYNVDGKNGGVGVTNTIITASEATTASVGEVDGSNVYFAGGGGGPRSYVGSDGSSTHGVGGLGGGGNAVEFNGAGSGDANTGGGGAGGRDRSDGYGWHGGDGGSGVVILRYPNTYTISNSGGGLTISTITQGDNKVSIITAGTGNVSWS